MEYETNCYTNIIIEVTNDDLPELQNHKSPTPVEFIGLSLTLCYRRSRFLVSPNGHRRLLADVEGHKMPLRDHLFRSQIFNRGEDDTLFRNLACILRSLKDQIDAESVAEAVMNRWEQIREEVNGRSSDIEFKMRVNLTVWMVENRHEIVVGGGGSGMIPASKEAVERMLKRVEIIEDDDDDDEEVCAICLDELKNKNGICGLAMPCFHVFHQKCILDWLNQSHSCPVCRFQLPVAASF